MNRLVDIKSLNMNSLCDYIEALGEKRFRGQQIYAWLHLKSITSFDEMTNISKSLLGLLNQNCQLTILKEVACLNSQIDGTKKFLFELSDGQRIESVFMMYHHGNSICISSQAGCKMGCSFCASTIGGLIRNLTPSEMLEQVYAVERSTGQKISNIVIMGTGEPFDNFDNFLTFIEIINSKEGRNIGQRSITVSTCGIVPKIIEFADTDLQVNLAISLHASNDELRKTLMPIASKYSLKDLLDSCHYYIEKTNRRITFEYSMISGVNDGKNAAYELADLLKGMLCHINLIPVNKVEGKGFNKSDIDTIKNFKNILEKQGLNTTIRRSLGLDVDAACGQLRRRFDENE